MLTGSRIQLLQKRLDHFFAVVEIHLSDFFVAQMRVIAGLAHQSQRKHNQSQSCKQSTWPIGSWIAGAFNAVVKKDVVLMVPPSHTNSGSVFHTWPNAT